MDGTSITTASKTTRLIALLLSIAALYLARDILVPTALAVLLTFLLSPLVVRFERWRIPHIPAVVITIVLTLIFTLSLGFLVGGQVVDLSRKLPDYKENLVTRVREIRKSSSGTFARLTGTFTEIKQELAASQPSTAPASVDGLGLLPQPPIDHPMKVEIVGSPSVDYLGITSMVAGSFVFPLSQLLVTLLLLIFLLLHQADVRDRLVWVAGMRQISLTTAAMEEVADRISKYLRTEAIVNTSFGLMIAIGLGIFGVPNAMLWGVVAGLLRFVPFVGPWIAASLTMLLTIAVFPGWSRPLGVVCMYAVMELFTNMVLEPWLYSASTGISSLGVVVASVFWAWVWGPVGLILAVPITVSLAVLGKHVPQFALIHYLFWSDASVPLVARLYQRLLVRDEYTVEQIVQEQLKESPFDAVCDRLLLPTLQHLKRDQLSGLINAEQVRDSLALFDSTCLADSHTKPSESKLTLLCVAAQNEIDAAAAKLLACAAEKKGIAAEAISSQSLASETAARVDESGVSWVAIVQVAPISRTHIRHLMKTLVNRAEATINFIEMSIDAGVSLAETCQIALMKGMDGKPVEVRREHEFAAMLSQLAELTYSEKTRQQACVQIATGSS
ncbi:MAG TPA: AI-2E family transporter [Tepidisphaeraceae bacterium]|nr:AI-2E family transporter [Tepidisphaeraceae bacterium]